ncbi:hypothetical protein FRX31_011043 [Thalictrum thalictroides]|uniref:Uncharacterized protein n=1 Tax=Thalictrum thalictroides TaxID=46969 RepID=A0A7J6WPS2_THATH|nr:hypothetical protein FRX31_011043 [Thalictrum thalictroides]
MVLSDVREHSGLICDNCQMYPVVGKRIKCKDCWEEHTCTERGYLKVTELVSRLVINLAPHAINCIIMEGLHI